MISSIRNPWIRRGILIAALVVYTPFAVLAAVLGVLWDCWRELRHDVPAAWRGPQHGR